jgi:hypothetical protein
VFAVRYALRGNQAAQVLANKSRAPGFACWLEYNERVVVRDKGSVVGNAFGGLLLGIGLLNFALFGIDMRRRIHAALGTFAIAISVFVFALVSSSGAESVPVVARAIQIVAVCGAALGFIAFCHIAFRLTFMAVIPGELWFAAGLWVIVQLTLLVIPGRGFLAALPNILYILGYAGIVFVFVRSYKRAIDSRSGEYSFVVVAAAAAAAVAPLAYSAAGVFPAREGFLTVVSALLVLVCTIVPTVDQLRKTFLRIYNLEVRVHELTAMASTSPALTRGSERVEPAAEEE